eukprot:2349663-Pyramimonas_sp.AAC.1
MLSPCPHSFRSDCCAPRNDHASDKHFVLLIVKSSLCGGGALFTCHGAPWWWGICCMSTFPVL